MADKGTLSKIAMLKPILQAKRLSMKIQRLAIGRAIIVTELLQLKKDVKCMKSNVGGKVLYLVE